jgi:hypothetical protein
MNWKRRVRRRQRSGAAAGARKLQHVAQILAKKPQLHLSVPGQYSEAADGAALRQQAAPRGAGSAPSKLGGG